jgi:hypothetical protein
MEFISVSLLQKRFLQTTRKGFLRAVGLAARSEKSRGEERERRVKIKGKGRERR